MRKTEMQDIADVCGMLADTTRLALMASLVKGGKSVGTLCRELGLAQPTASHHLALLRHTGVVDRQRKGKQMIYSLNCSMLTPVKKFLANLK